MVRVLPCRASLAGATGEGEHRSRVWPGLQRQTRRRPGVACAKRQPLHRVDRRSGWAGRYRLRRVWGAGNIFDRQDRHHPLQANWPTDGRGATAENPTDGAGTAEVSRTLRSCTHALVLLALALVTTAAAQSPAPDAALEARLKKLETELRCLVCQNQTLADSN